MFLSKTIFLSIKFDLFFFMNVSQDKKNFCIDKKMYRQNLSIIKIPNNFYVINTLNLNTIYVRKIDFFFFNFLTR